MQEVELGVFAVGIALGLPHGAVDHLVPFWRSWLTRSWKRLGAVLAGYVTVAALSFLVLWSGGAAALVVVLGLSVLHFGLADLTETQTTPGLTGPSTRTSRRTRVGRRISTVSAVSAMVVSRGAPVVVGPLLSWPTETGSLLRTIAPGLGLPGSGLRLGLAAATAVCVLLTTIVSWRSGQRRQAMETVLVAVLFLTAPPLAAFGLYFGGWHGLRHTARMIGENPANAADLAAGRIFAPVGRFVGAAALPTAVTVAALVGLVALAHARHGMTAPVFTLLFALTVPHLVVVALLDLDAVRRRPRFAARTDMS